MNLCFSFLLIPDVMESFYKNNFYGIEQTIRNEWIKQKVEKLCLRKVVLYGNTNIIFTTWTITVSEIIYLPNGWIISGYFLVISQCFTFPLPN